MTQRSVRRVEETPGLLILPRPFVPFPAPKPAPGGPPGTLYLGVTSNLYFRVKEHKEPEGESCSRAWVVERSEHHRKDKHRRGRLVPAATFYGAVTLSLSSRPERSGAEGPAV